MLTHLRRLQVFGKFNQLAPNNLHFFAKEVKKDAGKKDDKAAPAAPVIEEPKPE